MRVSITKTYRDTVLKREVQTGETLDVANNRGKVLTAAGVAEEVRAGGKKTSSTTKKKAEVKDVNTETSENGPPADDG